MLTKIRLQLTYAAARNDMVKDELKQAYASKVKDGQLNVFCVCNKIYQELAEEGDVEMVIASGVPSLRRFCYSITAKSQLEEAKNFLDGGIASLLTPMQLWVDSTQNVAVDLKAKKVISDKMTELEQEVGLLQASLCSELTAPDRSIG